MKFRNPAALLFQIAATLVIALAVSACGGARNARGTNITVTGSTPSDPVTGGGTVVFTMTVANSGDATASDVRIVNGIGNQLALTSITCSASGGVACPETPSVSMTIPTMGAGSSLTFVVSAKVGATANGTIVNTMTATISDDVDRTDNTFTAQANASTPSSNLVVGGTGPATVVDGGGSAVFAMTVRNDGPDAATGVRLLNTVGSNLTLTGVACTASGGAICPAALGVQMTLESLPVGGLLSFDVTAKVALGTNGAITNTFEATADHDATREDNKVVAVGNSEANNVGVTASAPSGNIAGGSLTSFTMVVANSGPAAAVDVAITDTLDAGLSLAGTIRCDATGGAVCPPSTGLTMTAPSIPIGGTLTFTVPATVSAGANGVLGNAMTAISSGDSGPANNTARAAISAVSVDLGVSETGATSVAAGSSAVFTALVANPGGGAASNLTINWTASAAFTTTNTVACTGTGGAVCPTVLGPVMTLPSLAAGRSLIFTFTVAVPDTARGAITNTVSISADGDPNLANNTSSVTTVASDSSNGSYKAYAADGRLYDMNVDFDARSYSMSGNGLSLQRSFVADATTVTNPDGSNTVGNGDYNVAGAAATTKFRAATDLLVGGENFGWGNLPYVAARHFGSTLNEMTGSYNLMSRNVSAKDASAVTRPATARASGNVLTVCETPTLVAPTTGCGSGFLKNFVVTVTDDLYTGVEAITGEVYSFRIASTGGSRMLLSSNVNPDPNDTANSIRQFRIGLTDAASLAGGTVRGPSSSGDWVNIALQPARYLFNGIVQTAGDDATLLPVSNAGPFAMLQGTRRTDGLTVYVMQAIPLVVAIDAPTTPAGLMQIALP